MESKGAKVSIIIPIYNGEVHIEKALRSLGEIMAGTAYELIIAEDGSTDKTPEILEKLRPEFSRMRILFSKTRLGKGKSLSQAILASKGEICLYMDVDAASGLSGIPTAINAMESADIVSGSRLFPGAKVSRSLTREIFSRGYNLLIRILFGSKLHDHQCGFKALRREKITPLLPLVKDTHWFWDTEMLILAQRKGLKVKEIPVEWSEGSDSTVRVLRDTIYMLGQMGRLFVDLNLGK
ncbi:MAG: glycosyltransferase family 2 protein [Candidatus Bilamarchaeaceae archaeon]